MATLVIWENNMSGRKGSYRTWAGHASLCLTDNWAGGLNKFDDYASWWPERETPGKHPAKPKPTVVEDIQREGYAPDWIIRFPANGLDAARMGAQWKVERGDTIGGGLRNKSYRFLRKNCATMVARILIAGGMAVATNYIVWTPVRVKDAALAAGGETMTWDDMKDEMRECGLSDADRRNANGTIIDFARDKGFCNSGAQPMFSRRGRCGAWTNAEGQCVLTVEPMDMSEN